MKRIVNGVCIEMTAEEIAAMQSENAAQIAAEASRALTLDEVVRLTIAKTVNTLDIPTETALRMVDYYPAYEQLVADGETVSQGFRFSYNGKLYRTMQPAHTFDGQFAPGVGTESLYSEVTLPGDGTAGRPIAYNGNMALEQGKYYAQDGIVYLCIRDTGIPVYNKLSDLTGIYVERRNPNETE